MPRGDEIEQPATIAAMAAAKPIISSPDRRIRASCLRVPFTTIAPVMPCSAPTDGRCSMLSRCSASALGALVPLASHWRYRWQSAVSRQPSRARPAARQSRWRMSALADEARFDPLLLPPAAAHLQPEDCCRHAIPLRRHHKQQLRLLTVRRRYPAIEFLTEALVQRLVIDLQDPGDILLGNAEPCHGLHMSRPPRRDRCRAPGCWRYGFPKVFPSLEAGNGQQHGNQALQQAEGRPIQGV